MITKKSKARQYNLDRQTATTSASSSGNVGKYEFLTKKRYFNRKKTVRKSCYNQNTWIFPTRQWVEKKKSNWHCKKKYQRLDKIHGFDKKDGVKKLTKIKKSQI